MRRAVDSASEGWGLCRKNILVDGPGLCEIITLREEKQMFNRKFKLFRLFGFEVGIDPTWIVLAVLVAWSLSTGYFPYEYKDLPTRQYWAMGVIGALGLFVSIVAHEFCHSLVARRSGMPMKGITLFISGGVAEMTEEPPSARDEFLIAVVGPISSFAMAAVFYGLNRMGKRPAGRQRSAVSWAISA
jgi:hypothetical protein